jgi:predicted membrane channel-forming protein YqfA (hemolysin III family)
MRSHSVGSRIAPESFLIAGLQMRTIITSSQLYQQKGRANMLFRGGFTYTNFLADVFSIFIFVLWFWLLITVFGDLFRRRDVSGLGKALWVIVLIVFPYLGVFIYLISQSRGMAERHNQRVEQARGELRQIVGFSVADEIEKLERLKNSGAISNEEYAHLRARAVQ